MLLSIAKLLRFIDRDYLDLAARLTDQAFRMSTAFAATLSMKAQIKANRGDIAKATGLYDKAMKLAEPGSEFHVYLMIMKAGAMLAGERRREVDHLAARLFEHDPRARASFGLFFVSPKAQTLAVQQEEAIARMPPPICQYLTAYLYRVSARQFTRRQHRRNVLKRVCTHIVRHHGDAAIAPVVANQLPELVGAG